LLAMQRELGEGSGIRHERPLVAGDAAKDRPAHRTLPTARTDASAALIQLSLMSPALQEAVGDVSDALAIVGTTTSKRDAEIADRQLNQSIARLRAAVAAYKRRKWWRRGKRPRTSIETAVQPTGQLSGALAKGRSLRQLR